MLVKKKIYTNFKKPRFINKVFSKCYQKSLQIFFFNATIQNSTFVLKNIKRFTAYGDFHNIHFDSIFQVPTAILSLYYT